ncbi:MAG: 2-amino-4-hydroxy-6-hydroxymethyldihydropteridine diphosphokinase, partial [Clostridia bacterium]|nr:2-amino-4-hydroxy-6-hydroxymethyldihydropteridine diphosphokinase [Clostridia bacterium]
GYLDLAVNMLEGDDNFRSLRESTRIESEPYGGVADLVFVNSVIDAQTLYTPRQLLDVVHSIEKAGDRVRKERWGNRTLDLDILFYDDIVLDEPDLSIPHPDTHNRDFVLNPLRELNEYLMHPFLRKRVKDLKPEKLTFPTEEK